MTAPKIIALAGLLAGLLDMTAASTLAISRGVPIERLWQAVASGALGTAAFEGGKGTASAGICFHFVIAFTVAAIYYALSRNLPILIDHPVLYGVLYGLGVHLVMSRIVIPLSAAPKREFQAKAFLIQALIHIFCVGLPIALTISRLSRRTLAAV